MLLRNPRQSAAGETDRRTFGFPGVAKELPFHRIKALAGREKPVTAEVAHDDTRRLRENFDDVSVRHFTIPRPLRSSARG